MPFKAKAFHSKNTSPSHSIHHISHQTRVYKFQMEIRPLHLPSEESLNGIKVYFITWLICLMFSQLISFISSGLKQAQTACVTPL